MIVDRASIRLALTLDKRIVQSFNVISGLVGLITIIIIVGLRWQLILVVHLLNRRWPSHWTRQVKLKIIVGLVGSPVE